MSRPTFLGARLGQSQLPCGNPTSHRAQGADRRHGTRLAAHLQRQQRDKRNGGRHVVIVLDNPKGPRWPRRTSRAGPVGM